MARTHPWDSVVTKLVACLIVGGLIITAGLSVLELTRAEQALQRNITERVTLTTRNLQGILRGMVGPDSRPKELKAALAVAFAEPAVEAVRLRGFDLPPSLYLGDWSRGGGSVDKVWPLAENGISLGDEVDLARRTQVQAPFTVGDRLYFLELLIDGPAARAATLKQIFGRLTTQWLFLAVMTLLGLLLLRRWFTGPLADIAQLVRHDADAEPFRRFAQYRTGEFADLAAAIAGMREGIDQTAERLAQRERAYEHLYQYAPTAMLSLGLDGIVKRANQRAATLFGAHCPEELVDRQASSLITSEDRPLLAEALERLAADGSRRCELRVKGARHTVDTAVEAVAVRNEDGMLRSFRLSMIDISETKRLQRQHEQQTRLMNLVIDHMSDAILLVDAEGHVAAFNQQLASLLQRRPESLYGATYDHDHFWAGLGLKEPAIFTQRLRQIEADGQRSAQERFETANGTYCFQGIPVHSALGESLGRLWVVQETTSQEQSQRLVVQQNRRLIALKEVSHVLTRAQSVDALVANVAGELYRLLNVDAVGIAVREAGDRRSRQVVHRGDGPVLLDTHRTIIGAVERDLLPEILAQPQFVHWPDLHLRTRWAKAFSGAGLTTLAAGPIRGAGTWQGLVWIAQRGGESLERHHMVMLETLMPLISARLETVQLYEQLETLELSDPTTGLPNAQRFDRALARIANRPGAVWAIVALELDRFGQINEQIAHEQADAVLRVLAERLLSSLRKGCVLARGEGASFNVLLPEVSLEQAVIIAERLRRVLANTPVPLDDGSEASITASVGVATCLGSNRDPQQVLRTAISRAKLSKASGRNRVTATGPHTTDRAAG